MAIQFGICNEIFEGWSLDDTVAFVARAGYDCLEIAPFTLARHVTDIPAATRAHARELAARHNIRISGIHWVLAQTEGLHMTCADDATRQRTSDYFCHLVDFCADLGGQSIVVGSPRQRSLTEDVSHEQGLQRATEVFRAGVAHAAARNVTLCLEPLSPADTNFINTHTEAIAFIKQFQSPHFKIILDTKAMCSMGKPIPQIIRESRGHFAYFHANDENLKGPGFGAVDFKPIAAALREVGYDGVVSVEVFKFEEGPEAIATRSLEYLKRTFAA